MSSNFQFPVVANVSSSNKLDTSLFEKSSFVHANTECPICLEPIVEKNITLDSGSPLAKNITALNCHHVMCTSCFVNYIQRNHNCPICRKSMFTMDVTFNQQVYVVPLATSLGQRLHQQLSSQESTSLLRGSRTSSLRDAPPLRSSRSPSHSPSETRFGRQLNRTVSNHYQRRREMSDYDDDQEDYDRDIMRQEDDRQNIYHGAGRTAAVMMFVIADIAIMTIWLLSLWITS